MRVILLGCTPIQRIVTVQKVAVCVILDCVSTTKPLLYLLLLLLFLLPLLPPTVHPSLSRRRRPARAAQPAGCLLCCCCHRSACSAPLASAQAAAAAARVRLHEWLHTPAARQAPAPELRLECFQWVPSSAGAWCLCRCVAVCWLRSIAGCAWMASRVATHTRSRCAFQHC